MESGKYLNGTVTLLGLKYNNSPISATFYPDIEIESQDSCPDLGGIGLYSKDLYFMPLYIGKSGSLYGLALDHYQRRRGCFRRAGVFETVPS